MKKNYLRNVKPGPVGRLWALLALLWFVPLLGQAQSVTFTAQGPNQDPGSNSITNPQYFGQVAVGDFSVSKTYTVTGTGLPANTSINVVIPSNFQGSLNDVSFSASTISLTTDGAGSLTPTTVYLRFAPNSGAGTTINRSIFAQASDAGGDPIISSPTVKLRGDAIAGTATINLASTSLSFGNQQVNSISAPQNIEFSATTLTAPVTVTAPAGFQVSYNGSAYAATVAVPQNGSGAINNAIVSVVFAPTVAQAYITNIVFSSAGATARNVGVSGTGTLPPASLSSAPTQLNFGTLQAGQVSTPQNFTVTGSNITSSVTVSAPIGFLIRLGASGNFVQNITLNPVSNLVNANLQASFAPSSAGSYNSIITATTTGNGGASTGVAVTGNATAAPTGPFILVNPSSLDFGTVSNSGSAQTLTFAINAGNLTTPLVLTGSSNNIVFRDASVGGSFVNGPITINQAPDGSVSIRNIEVRLVAPLGSGGFVGTITASSGSASAVVDITATSTGGNSTINVSGVLNQFSTVPGVASNVQSYIVSGTNLLQGVTVTAPQYFQVSLDANFTGILVTGNSFVIPQGPAGDIANTTVYVRFLPPSALSTTSIILNSSSPATSQAIQVNGTSEPSILIANAFQEVRKIVINTESPSQALTINAQRVLQPITISKLLSSNPLNPNSVQQFELSLDGVTFSNTLTLTPNASTYVVNSTIYVRYLPTYLGSGQSTLQFQSNDFSNTSTQSFGVNDLLTGRSIDVEPTMRSTATVTRTGSTALVTFNLPPNYAALGFGEGRIIVASLNSSLPAASQPEDGVSYQTGNQTYGLGPQIAPGYFVVYSGANNAVTIDGLNPATTYYFYTFEYNNIDNNFNVAVSGAENYLSPPVPNQIPGIEAPGEPPLPVTLVSFSAKVSGSQVAIRWETASELNNKRFEVERSNDSRTFETILTRDGQSTTNGTTVYNEVDRQPINGLSYYRLKQVDLDGKSSYSAIVPVNFLKAGDVSMYPNPVTNQLTITLGGNTEGVSVVITDLTGRTVRTQKLPTDGKLDMTNLQSGTYLVTVGNSKSKVTRRVVKQ